MPKQAADHLSRRLTVALGLHQVVAWGTTFYIPAVILDAVARDLGATRTSLLVGFSGALIVAGGCAPAIGAWIGCVGGRQPMACGALLLALGLVILAVAPDLRLWWLGWAVLGLAMALSLYDAAFAAAGVALGPAATVTITGIALIGGFASTLGWPAGSLLLPHLGWRGLLLVYATLHLAVTLPLVLLAVPRALHGPTAPLTTTSVPERRRDRLQIACIGAFFALRWFITSAIAVHVLILMGGLGLSPTQAMAAAMLIGPGQVVGRLLEWITARRLDPLSRARVGALLFPAGALLLISDRVEAAFAFAVLYGMSNGILTVNRGTLPMVVLGPQRYAARLGWIALPVMLAQATAPTLTAPWIAATRGAEPFILAGAIAGASALLLLPLRARSGVR